jgi:hypothetical protein
LHVEDRGQLSRNDTAVVRRMGLAVAVENCVVAESRAKPKPVMAVAAIGEMPMLPAIAEAGTLDMPLFARMT